MESHPDHSLTRKKFMLAHSSSWLGIGASLARYKTLSSCHVGEGPAWPLRFGPEGLMKVKEK